MPRNILIFLAVFGASAIVALVWWRAGTGARNEREGRGPQDVLVTLTEVRTRNFADVLEAVGTAKANESVELTAKSSETISALNFTDGQSVPAGFIVAELSKREQTADELAARSTAAEAARTLERIRALHAKGFATKAQLDAALTAQESGNARLQAMASRMNDRVIRTPFAGVLGLRRVSAGTLVRPGDVITTLDEISLIKVDFTVPEAALTSLTRGMKVRVSAAAFPGKTFAGKVDGIDTRIDPASRSIAVRAIIDNKEGTLKPGMLMTVGVLSRERVSLFVPEQSIVPIESRQHVYVPMPGDVVERKVVTTGAREPGFVEILAGLKAGDKVVVEGTHKLRPGASYTLDAKAAPGAPKDGKKWRRDGSRPS